MSLKTLFFLCAFLLLTGCDRLHHAQKDTAPNAITQSKKLEDLVEDYYEQYLKLNPIAATANGDARFNDRLLNDISEQGVADALALEKSSLQSLAAINPAELDEPHRQTYDIFKFGRESAIEGYTYPFELLPINQFDCLPLYFAEMGAGNSVQPFATAVDYDNFLKRIAGFVTWVDQAITNMKQGAARGVVQPKIVIERAIGQFAQLAVDDPSNSLFYKPVANFPDEILPQDRARLTAAYTKAIREQLTPAYRRLNAFLEKEYLPQSRASVGLTALPNGISWYTHLVRSYTTSQLTPTEIHDLGRQELARIRGEMEKVRVQVGFKEDLKAFMASLREDPKLKFTSAEDLLQRYADLQQRVTTSLPALFAELPQGGFEIRPVEEFRERSAAPAYFLPGTPDGKRPGIFYVNTFSAASRPSYVTESIYMHEADPGHHLQLTLQSELTSLPRFRRFSQETAYVEGWGLYAESLGKELGLYQDPYQYFGSLSAEAWRAVRLIVDTGMHAKGWTREKAMDFMRENTALSDAEIAAEVERYIAKPGQALAYKIGQLKIRELRTMAEKRLGAAFDVREFHRAVLDGGSMPLEVLQAKIDRWIAAQQAK